MIHKGEVSAGRIYEGKIHKRGSIDHSLWINGKIYKEVRLTKERFIKEVQNNFQLASFPKIGAKAKVSNA